VLPIERGVSWQTHLAAALIGVVMAILLRHLDVSPRVRYTWEAETADDEDATDDGFPDADYEPDTEPGAFPRDRDRPTLH